MSVFSYLLLLQSNIGARISKNEMIILKWDMRNAYFQYIHKLAMRRKPIGK